LFFIALAPKIAPLIVEKWLVEMFTPQVARAFKLNQLLSVIPQRPVKTNLFQFLVPCLFVPFVGLVLSVWFQGWGVG
jgi:hypothetical protein